MIEAKQAEKKTLMPFCFLWISLLAISLFLIVGCSTPESQGNLDTALCWLRPSCQPSQPKVVKASAPPITSKSSPVRSNPKPVVSVSSPKLTMPRCLTSAKTMIQASKPYITVSYIEPTTQANGQALTNLAKTTIYQDQGKGFVKYKDIPATKPEGGGKIQEKIHYEIPEGTSLGTTICVTATNTHGQER